MREKFRCKPQVGYVDTVAVPTHPHQEVLGLDVLVDDILRMNVLESGNDLVCQHQYRLEREKSATVIEEIFEAGTQKLEHHDSVFTLLSIPVDLGYPLPASE